MVREVRQDYANRLRRRRPQPGDNWYLDEVFLTINGERYYLWRAVDQDDNVLDILVQKRRNKKAAKKFFRIIWTVKAILTEGSDESDRARLDLAASPYP